MLSSRLDAVAEPDAAVVYCEWTMEFKNVSSQQREARAQVAVPPGAVVSRVTLWIDGEEREAAFGPRAQTRAAYREVAVGFPVPANGGVMKVKPGITAPLLLDSTERGQFVCPRFLERNFSVPSSLRHELWIASPQRLSIGEVEAAKPVSPEKPFTLRNSWSEAEISRTIKAITVDRDGQVKDVWTAAADGNEYIQQRIEPSAMAAIRRLVLVLDGSEGMDSFAWQLSEAITSLPNHIELKLLIANDSASSRDNRATTFQPERVDAIQRRLSRAQFQGGQDNLPTLLAAWDLASAVEGGAVLWVHGPTPVLLSAESGLIQRLERNTTRTRLFEAQTVAGPDRILEKLDGRSSLRTVPRVKSLREDLAHWVAQWNGNALQFEFKREKTTTRPSGVQGSRHIERLWARDESLRLAQTRKTEEATKLAVKNQLVTPVSGAVVLERKEQYDRHKLTPAGPETVPSVPEPTALSLVGVGLLAIAMARKRAARLARAKNPPSQRDPA